ncbi:PREDICTED: uncharacterized protein LOC108363340 [Rhagoletis zephyria]|uniref:uncharacterized protein LOC108363340 n=1 Tax=Rhagoletis zephyria TaxID=28612 RepID=UPI0008112622|nr:PREDICTED: uncharacterized protein LOC108363340 [Rhagoletis zephyria]
MEEDGNKLNITCSPGTSKKVQDDAVYRQKIISDVAGEQCFESIIITEEHSGSAGLEESFSEEIAMGESEGEDFLPIGTSAETPHGKRPAWLDAPTKLLILKFKELRPKAGKSQSMKNKKQMWSRISKELCEKGYIYTSSQVEGKFYSVERQYKKLNSITLKQEEPE